MYHILGFLKQFVVLHRLYIYQQYIME